MQHDNPTEAVEAGCHVVLKDNLKLLYAAISGTRNKAARNVFAA
jgi:hypothetical protein